MDDRSLQSQTTPLQPVEFIPRLAWVVPNFISLIECKVYCSEGETRGYERHQGSHRQLGRTILTDPSTSIELWPRTLALLQQLGLARKHATQRRATRIALDMRSLRYDEGDFFQEHRDLPRVWDKDESSMFSIVIYLDTHGADYAGGELMFPDFKGAMLTPAAGTAVLFSQYAYGAVHSVLPVTFGCKRVLRGDILFRGENEEELKARTAMEKLIDSI